MNQLPQWFRDSLVASQLRAYDHRGLLRRPAAKPQPVIGVDRAKDGSETTCVSHIKGGVLVVDAIHHKPAPAKQPTPTTMFDVFADDQEGATP